MQGASISVRSSQIGQGAYLLAPDVPSRFCRTDPYAEGRNRLKEYASQVLTHLQNLVICASPLTSNRKRKRLKLFRFVSG